MLVLALQATILFFVCLFLLLYLMEENEAEIEEYISLFFRLFQDKQALKVIFILYKNLCLWLWITYDAKVRSHRHELFFASLWKLQKAILF